MKEYVITFKLSTQISPDDWEVYHPSLKVTENTTVKEIGDWVRKYTKTGLVEVRLIELETPTTK